ncbi:MAG TPA: DUF5916 domain-containing protein [Gemmatimonadaceae bacterium]|nr:DUF5916 domain-containing protein [Gemmatimonadaceae bacterium]
MSWRAREPRTGYRLRAGCPRACALARAAALAVLSTGRATAQSDSALRAGRGPTAPAVLSVARVRGTLRLDGRLNDPSWATADSITDFRQREPVEGAPASERTVVKVLRDAEALYVGVRAYDRSPAAIRASQLRRDADLSSDDNITLLIDSFHDRRSAFVFQTNPNGAMWDAQFSGVDDLNENWNGIWEVASTRDSLGWAAELRIPLRTLRFEAGTGAAFGFNVRRFIRRKNEETLWRGWGRTQGLYHLLAEGDLVGLGVLSRARDVALLPYVLTRAVVPAHDTAGTRLSAGSLGARVGGDAKIALSPTLTADLTVNTDFAQVEADRQVINLTRFPLFFPEKREFFLESSGIFAFGAEGRAQLFYSRRIGLDTLGAPVPILGGGRVTGRVGPWTVGVLDARTGGSDAANDVVVRLTHDLFARSYIGAMAVDRSGPGVPGAQRAGGLDIDLPLVVRGHNVEPKLWAAATSTPSVRGTPVAWRLSTDYPNDLFDNFISLYRIDSGFAPALGFVRRTGIWETTGHIDYMPRPGVLGVRQLEFEAPIPTWDIIAGEHGSPRTLADSRTWQTATFQWQLLGGTLQHGDEFAVKLLRLMDAPASPFGVFRDIDVAAGRYWWTRGQLEYETSAGRPVSIGATFGWGGFYEGRSTDASLSGTWRGGGHVILGADLSRTEATLPGGHFVATQSAARVEYAFTTRSDFLGFVQFNNEDRRADFDLRYHWIPKIGDDLFVVWSSGYTTEAGARYRFPSTRALGRPLDGALVLKLVHRL